jgi:hypothetical protein
LEWIFLVLKVAGIIGAFAGFSAERKPGERTSRGGKVFAYIFLSLAIAAEACDSSLRVKDSHEQAERFERLAHPLGTIWVRPSYAIDLHNIPGIMSYRSRIARSHRLFIEPNPKTEPEISAIFHHQASLEISFLKRGFDGKGGPNLSFRMEFPRDAQATTAHLGLITNNPSRDDRSIDTALFLLVNGRIFSSFPEVPNTPDNRYSDGHIISLQDLLGGRMQVTLCVATDTGPKGEYDSMRQQFDDLFTLQGFHIVFPGGQSLDYQLTNRNSLKAERIKASPNCSAFTATLPETEGPFSPEAP